MPEAPEELVRLGAARAGARREGLSGRPTRSVTGSRRPAGRWWTSPTARSAWSRSRRSRSDRSPPRTSRASWTSRRRWTSASTGSAKAGLRTSDRAIAAFRAHAGGRRCPVRRRRRDGRARRPVGRRRRGARALEPGTGWASARNAGLRRSRGRIVLAMDGSVEPTGDVFGPLEGALADPKLGVCGPFGIVTTDLRQFDEAPGAGPCDAIEGYLMAFRREMLAEAGFFDEKFSGTGPRTSSGRSASRTRATAARWSSSPSSNTSTGCGSKRPSRAGHVVEAELLPVPGPMARPLGSRLVRQADRARTDGRDDERS